MKARHTASDAALNDLLSAIQLNFDIIFPPKEGNNSHIATGFISVTVLFYTMIVFLFRRNSAIKYYVHSRSVIMPIKGCRPWKGVRAQRFSSHG